MITGERYGHHDVSRNRTAKEWKYPSEQKLSSRVLVNEGNNEISWQESSLGVEYLIIQDSKAGQSPNKEPPAVCERGCWG